MEYIIFFPSSLFANVPFLFQLHSFFLTANPATFQGKLERTPAQCNKRQIMREVAFLVEGDTLLNQTSLITVETVKEIFPTPPYSSCPTLIHRMNLMIHALYLNAPANWFHRHC